ncbi:hypothetical protein T4B_15000 [Trichinella pseudospiralis]|uniref:Uncharacterized protein n=1 Tax=Trichinella pseudospiralis TaxID=6337 RepID=A0A0V1HIK6_TRIPS|nr:hypothetical protein T4B_15000 [Trichinella pseudospiralis]
MSVVYNSWPPKLYWLAATERYGAFTRNLNEHTQNRSIGCLTAQKEAKMENNEEKGPPIQGSCLFITQRFELKYLCNNAAFSLKCSQSMQKTNTSLFQCFVTNSLCLRMASNE